MTVSAQSVTPTIYTLDGVTTTWTYPGKLFEDDHADVRIADSEGIETILELDEDYTVTGVGEPQATIILATAAGTSGKRLVLGRVLPLDRQTIIAPGPFPPEVIDNDLDRVVMQIQQLQEQINRAVLQSISTTVRGLTLPFPPDVGDPEVYLSWSDDRTRLINRAVVADSVQNPDAKVTTRYPDDAGLSTVSGFDNTELLNPYLQEMSDGGGGTFRLESADGASYDFPGGIEIPSLVTLEMKSPVNVGPTGVIRIQGDTANAFEGLRLVSNGSLAGTTLVVDTAPVGGGAVSEYMKVGGSIAILGPENASGVRPESETNSVTAINDGTRTITLSDPLNYAYLAVGSIINVHTCAMLDVDNTLRSDSVVVRAADVALISAGDWVQIEDNRRTDGAVTYIEIRQVLAVEEDGDNVITLNGQLRRIYLVSENARLTVLNPAVRALVVGGSVIFTGTADVARVDPVFEMSRTIDCLMVDCEVPNTDAVGRRGPMHRTFRSYNSHYLRSSGRNPKFLGDGEGNGGVIAYSTRCSMSQPVYQGTRHGCQFIAATECAFEEVDLSDQRLTALDHHGLNSVGCYSTARRVSFSGRTASASNVAIVFGNSTLGDGDHECVAMGGQIDPFEGAGAVAVVRFFPPSTNCYVIGVRGRNIEKFVIHRDNAGSDLISLNCGVLNCSVDGATDYVLDLQGGLNGSAVRTLQGFVFRDFVGTNLKRGLYLDQVTLKAMNNVSLSFASPDALHAVRMIDVPSPRVVNLLLEGVHEGLRLEDCPDGFWLKCDVLDIAETEWLDDDGGNDGTEFRGCNAYTADGDAVTLDNSGGSTIIYKAVSNIGTETTTAYEFAGANKVLGAITAGVGVELDFTAAARALGAATTAIAQNDLLFGIGANIASAATTDLATATEVAIIVTGTTTITSFGTVARGLRFVTFAGSLTLTHHGTSLILPGGANIQTAAGDVAFLYSLGGGSWKCMAYVRAAGSLATQLATNVAITGGSIAGITDLAIADGGSGQSTAYAANDAFSVKGADIASATTTDLAAATGWYVDVTGTTTITGLGTAAAGVFRAVRFTGALTLTHNGTSLILPGAASIVTVANDRAFFVSLGSGNWLCLNYQRVDGVGGVAVQTVARGGTGQPTKALARVALTGGPTALTDGASIATDCSLNDSFSVTLGGNRTLANPTNVVAGVWYTWAIRQDGTGSRTLTLGANFIPADGETFAMKAAIASTTMLVAYADTTTRLLFGFKKYA